MTIVRPDLPQMVWEASINETPHSRGFSVMSFVAIMSGFGWVLGIGGFDLLVRQGSENWILKEVLDLLYPCLSFCEVQEGRRDTSSVLY